MNERSDRLSRRAALQGLGVGLGMAGIGCGTDPAPSTPDPTGSGNAPPASTTPSKPGPPGPSNTTEPPPPKLTPKELLAGIEHIVVLMMENRSFDHFLGALSLDAGYANKATVSGLKGTETNPAPNGSDVAVFKMANFTPEDPPHGWDEAHSQFNEGQNDGFVKAHAGASQNEVMGYHDRSQIPLYYWFADNFAICDNWFASVMGPTWPNRFYLHATTSKGKKANSPLFIAPKTIWDALKSKNVSAKNYRAGALAWILGGMPAKAFGDLIEPIEDFFDGAQNGTLPSFCIIDPDFQASDDHPAHNIQRGQAFVASVYQALAQSPLWFKTLLVITYDENGGFYDHVAPPTTVDEEPEFTQLGFRVPALVIGPTVKKGYVCKTQLEHSSVAATLKTRWDIGSLTERMNVTNDISDCIDAVKVNAPSVPPTGMPTVAMTLQNALYDGVGTSSQPKLDEMVAEGIVQAVDIRSHQARIGSWLEHATRLGAVRIVGT
jgi:phospholipase C